MGLALEVGMLADLLANDEEGAGYFREDLAKLNGVLATAALSPHDEPSEGAVHSASMFGYSGLHYLRRCAAHLQYRDALPPPLADGEEVTSDALLQRYGAEFTSENIDAKPGMFAAPSQRRFDHLIMHSDAEGFYLPQMFERVLISGDQAYGWVGSCHSLRAECQQLAEALEMPIELLNDSESDVLFKATQRRDTVRPKWRLFGPKHTTTVGRDHPIAALSCAKLYCFANYAIQGNAALVFC